MYRAQLTAAPKAEEHAEGVQAVPSPAPRATTPPSASPAHTQRATPVAVRIDSVRGRAPRWSRHAQRQPLQCEVEQSVHGCQHHAEPTTERHAEPVCPRRRGRAMMSSRTAEKSSRSMTMPSGPVSGKSITANDAPTSWHASPTSTSEAADPCRRARGHRGVIRRESADGVAGDVVTHLLGGPRQPRLRSRLPWAAGAFDAIAASSQASHAPWSCCRRSCSARPRWTSPSSGRRRRRPGTRGRSVRPMSDPAWKAPPAAVNHVG